MAGRKPWHMELPGATTRLFYLRRRADIASAFSELILETHPWDRDALRQIGSTIVETLTLFRQIKQFARDADKPVRQQLRMDRIELALEYDGIDKKIPWSNDESGRSYKETYTYEFEARGFLGGSLGQLHARLSLSFNKGAVDADAIRFIDQELKFHTGHLIPSSLLNAREKWDTEPALGWLNGIWDLRVRLADFVSRFLAQYRRESFLDPFTVFFLKPSKAGDGGYGVRSGAFGYEFVLDGGQVKHLRATTEDDYTDSPLRLPYPVGVCAGVFLSGRASTPHDMADAHEGYKKFPQYKAELKRIEKFEASVIDGGMLIEVPVYAKNVGDGPSDGPSLIATVRVRTPDHRAAWSKAFPDIKFLHSSPALKKPERDVFGPVQPHFLQGEAQIVTEVCQRHLAQYLRASIPHRSQPYVWVSKTMRSLHDQYTPIAQSDFHVLITGPSGSGKSHLAKEIVEISQRPSDKFRHLSAATLPGDKAVIQLFGTVEGIFTGAKNKPGLLEVLDGGTLFIDDIDALDIGAQARLLTYLDEKQFYRWGGAEKNTPPIPSDVRIIAATNVELSQLAKGTGEQHVQLREDFLHRIKEMEIKMPPLADRKEDIRTFIDIFLKEDFAKANRDRVPVPTDGFYDLAKRYDWHDGQLRELRNTLRRCMVFTNEGVLTEDHLARVHSAFRQPKRESAV